MLGMFCRDELRREGLGAVLHETADNEREYLARHNVLPEWWNGLSGRGRFDELAVRVRDYPSPLPANVQENRAVFDELKRELKLIELDTERPEPEIWQKIDSLRARLQDNSIDCELLPKDGPAKVEVLVVGGAAGDVAALVASVAPVKLTSPPWRKGIGGAVEKCLLVYIAEGKEIAMADLGGKYQKRPDKLAGLVRDEIDFAMKSEKSPFVPIEGRRPVGRTAGGIMRITFDGDKSSTKRGRKPRES